MKTLPQQDELYPDAISPSDEAWIKKYMHKDYRTLVERFGCAKEKPHISSRLQIDPELYSDTDPRLVMAWTRLFLLGVQIASEKKGNEGKSPATAIHLGIPYVGGLYGIEHNACCTDMELDGRVVINVTGGLIKMCCQSPYYKNELHMPDRTFDIFQNAIVAGVEEGLHAESYKIPEFARAVRLHGHQLAEISEGLIHDDLVSIIAHDLNLQCDNQRYLDFMQLHFPDVLETWQPAKSWRTDTRVSPDKDSESPTR